MSMPSEPKTASNAAVNFASRSRIRNRNEPTRSPMSCRRLRALLGGPLAGRVRGDAQDVHPPSRDLHHEQHIQPAQGDGVDAEEISGQQPRGLGTQERAPGRVAAARCRADSGSGQDATDGAGADPVTEPEQLALDAAMAPRRVLPSESHHQVADLVADGRAAGPVRIRPRPADQPAVPGQQGRRGDNTVRPQLAGQHPGQRGRHRAIRPRQPRPADLAAQHGHLVPQHHDLDVLRRVRSGQQRQPAQHPHQAQVQHPRSHGQRSCRAALPSKPAGQRCCASSGTVQDPHGSTGRSRSGLPQSMPRSSCDQSPQVPVAPPTSQGL